MKPPNKIQIQKDSGNIDAQPTPLSEARPQSLGSLQIAITLSKSSA